MSLSGAFLNSSMAMTTQSYAMGQISNNITNINTTGYKSIDTTFRTMIPEQPVGSSPYGIGAVSTQLTEVQGVIYDTGNNLDIAINGQGFFMTNDTVDLSGETYYTRDGHFRTQMVYDQTGTTSPPESGDTSGATYLVTASGQYVMGWAADQEALENGEYPFPTNDADTGGVDGTESLAPVRLNESGTMDGVATSEVKIYGNIDQSQDIQVIGMNVWGPESEQTSLDGETYSTWPSYDVALQFESINKQENTWAVSVQDLNGAAGTIEPSEIAFTSNATLAEPEDGLLDVSVTYTDGVTHSFTIDINDLTQYAGETGDPTIHQMTVNGYPEGVMSHAFLDDQGVVWGEYTNGRQEQLYKLALADFPASPSLAPEGSNLYSATPEAGERVIFSAGNAPWVSSTQLVPNALEMSNVDLTDQFSVMITTQTAYSTAATVFKTCDEMTQTASMLKS